MSAHAAAGNFESTIDHCVELRRKLHAAPESAHDPLGEVLTAATIAGELENFCGIAASAIRKNVGLVGDVRNGVYADIHGTGPAAAAAGGPACVALRSELDGLQMTELNATLPYRSAVAGHAHMCGHDGHMASLVATAALLQARAHLIPAGKRVRVLFQPAEEGPGGAAPMIEDGCLDEVDEIYGYHNWPMKPAGVVQIKPGAMMAHVSNLTINITGVGVHGSLPECGKDAVLCGAAVVVALQQVVSRCVPSDSRAVVSVCTFHSGEAGNVLPDTAKLTGTIRDLDPVIFALVDKKIREVVAGTCAAYGCQGETIIASEYPVVMNHAKETANVAGLARDFFGADMVTEDGVPVLGAEDFAYFLQKKPGCFWFLGSIEKERTGFAAYEAMDKLDAPRTNCACHQTAYDFNDNLVPNAAAFFVKVVENRLGVELYSKGELGSTPAERRAAGASSSEPAKKKYKSGDATLHCTAVAK